MALGLLALQPLLACVQTPERPSGTVEYIGSSTVAGFLHDAEGAYGAIDFLIDTAPESHGGELAILAGKADLAGLARMPAQATLEQDVVATLIGRDAIAVLVSAQNPVTELSMEQLRGIFSGEIQSWSEVGGPDLAVMPYIVAPESATREVFRSLVLGSATYSGCHQIRPDGAMAAAVSSSPGGIGHLSMSLLDPEIGARAIRIAGESPSVSSLDYPISRPLYLLWRHGNPVVEAFVQWTQTVAGQNVVMQRFVGRRVVGAVRSTPGEREHGTLLVFTETEAIYDGGIYYYPHLPYEILTQSGQLVRRVPNRRGENDERPMRVDVPPGTYLIRTKTRDGDGPEFFVTIEDGRRTELDVVALLQQAR
ncbi:MAG: phosphate transport system substrate-binding protein [Chlamydiales bacterium]|jgi:phosphate transport system substrate-binding protein